ncbi:MULTISPECIES: glycosyltransferase [Acinetobacter]|uniref:glycosyltransferase n=1 Tax=Acinetobacter TaxID=469 RepID=UPI002580F8EE|nr:glycosyltransferase [Acinetobacter sp. UBA5984]
MKPKVLLINEGVLQHYRVSLFNSLTEDVDLCVAHIGDKVSGTEFNQITYGIVNIGPFSYYSIDGLNEYDYVIFPFNLRNLNLYLELFKIRNYKKILFGIGVNASYRKGYDAKDLISVLRILFVKKYDYSIFYEKYPILKYISWGVSPKKMSVAYNTVTPNKKFNIEDKTYESIIFIGSLYKQKKIFDLIEAYSILIKNDTNFLNLEIIGDGQEFNNLRNYIEEKGLQNHVKLHGNIITDDHLLPIMQRAAVCVSPGQAGLSVQKSFSYGVGFITTQEAITGGEILSIQEGVTGDFYDGSINDLVRTLKKYCDINYCKSISINSYFFYNKFRSVRNWREGFLRNIK